MTKMVTHNNNAILTFTRGLDIFPISYKEKEMIDSWFMEVLGLQNKCCTLSSKLLSDLKSDGVKGSDSYRKCHKASNTFSIVQNGI